jgi:glycosyltransferase involved in cell wall biosynthesis
MVSLTAVVPATNDPPTLAACLDAIAAAEEPPEQVVIVAEGDGPASARNSGAADATGDVVVFVDADVLPHADAVGRIRAAFAADPDLTAVFGSYDDAPADPGVVSQFRNLLHHHVHQQGAGEARTFWAGLGAVRADAFREAGGFDAERYKLPSVEDIDLGTSAFAVEHPDGVCLFDTGQTARAEQPGYHPGRGAPHREPTPTTVAPARSS